MTFLIEIILYYNQSSYNNMASILSTRTSILQALDSTMTPCQNSILAMYNSRLKGIIKDPALMSVSIDDHIVHRGHSVFDTLHIYEGKAYNIDRHIRRIIYSSSLAKIELPMPDDLIRKALLDLAACTGKQYLNIRYWISAGPGSMSIWPMPGQSTFYAIAYEDDLRTKFESINEITVSIPIKPRYLAIMKSTNYLLNALCAMEAKEKGGHYGIQTDENGFITEGSVNNVCFILPNKTLVTPTFDKILNGTTIERIFYYLQPLIDSGELSGIEQRDIHINEAKSAVEMFTTSGDSISPVLNWDGVPIGDGTVGKFSTYLREKMFLDYVNPEISVPVDYSVYENQGESS